MQDMLTGFPPPPTQNQWTFVNDLRTRTPRIFPPSDNAPAPANNANLNNGVSVSSNVPDPDGVLTTAFQSLQAVFKDNHIPRGSYKITASLTSGFAREEFRIDTTREGTLISASDTEGIRRGIYALEDLFLENANGTIPCGRIQRKPWLKNRICRCFFSPVKRWPVNTDELLDDVDYYPDGYLDKLAHEGINGLWLVVALRELGQSSFTPLDSQAPRRIAKLNRTVAQCARFGIKMFIFCIEPFSVFPDDPLLASHPELFGTTAYGRRTFCPASPATRQYLREITYDVFRQVPGLGGIINITHGERPTTCLSALNGSDEEPIPCPECAKIGAGKSINYTLQAMSDGMKSANPDATLIAWFYFPHTNKQATWTQTIGRYMPKGVLAQFNFESGGTATQLGREHTGGDYWLCYTGPSERFATQAKNAREAGCEICAKLQVGCGYELGIVPFIPAPGIIFDKFRKMSELGVSSAMFCWYVGNYPGIMNTTGGRLAFRDMSQHIEKLDFLQHLAAPLWGKYAPIVSQAWKLASDAYAGLPFSLMFQYYGPQNAGSVWRLTPYPELRPLSPPWKPIFPPSGDAIGEALAGFTIQEALTLMSTLNQQWRKAWNMMSPLKEAFANYPERLHDLTLMEALSLHFQNSCNILRFYQLRAQFFSAPSNDILEEMRTISLAEQQLSLDLAQLCQQDSRLGFHSEALCHRYYPELLKQRSQDIANRTIPEIDSLVNISDPWDAFIKRQNAPIQLNLDTPLVFSQASLTATKDSNTLQLSVTLPRDFTGQLAVYIMDAAGIVFPSLITYGIDKDAAAPVSENFTQVLGYKTPLASPDFCSYQGNLLTLRYPLELLPVTHGRIRLNMQLYGSGLNAWASGTPYEHRLYLWAFAPNQTFILKIT